MIGKPQDVYFSIWRELWIGSGCMVNGKSLWQDGWMQMVIKRRIGTQLLAMHSWLKAVLFSGIWYSRNQLCSQQPRANMLLQLTLSKRHFGFNLLFQKYLGMTSTQQLNFLTISLLSHSLKTINTMHAPSTSISSTTLSIGWLTTDPFIPFTA